MTAQHTPDVLVIEESQQFTSNQVWSPSGSRISVSTFVSTGSGPASAADTGTNRGIAMSLMSTTRPTRGAGHSMTCEA